MQARDIMPRRPRDWAALTAQVPQRVGDLRRRGERMLRDGWDINALLLLAEDAEALADASARLDDTPTSELLIDFAECLWSFLDQPAVPDADGAAAIAARLELLVSAPQTVTSGLGDVGEEATLFGYAANEDNGFPLLVRPPAHYWRRFAGDVQAPAPASRPPIAPAAERAPATPPARVVPPGAPTEAALSGTPVTHDIPDSPLANDADSTRKRACHLGDGSTMADEIDLKLRAMGYEVQRPAGIDELKELLSRAPPSLLVLAETHHAAIEEIGALVQAARARINRRLAWVALSRQTDLANRLRIMRAGCEALVTP